MRQLTGSLEDFLNIFQPLNKDLGVSETVQDSMSGGIGKALQVHIITVTAAVIVSEQNLEAAGAGVS